jgi:hypothetical protein
MRGHALQVLPGHVHALRPDTSYCCLSCFGSVCVLCADNNKAEGSGQPPSELFRSGELAFGSFGDEDSGEVGKLKQQGCCCTA